MLSMTQFCRVFSCFSHRDDVSVVAVETLYERDIRSPLMWRHNYLEALIDWASRARLQSHFILSSSEREKTNDSLNLVDCFFNTRVTAELKKWANTLTLSVLKINMYILWVNQLITWKLFLSLNNWSCASVSEGF